MRDVNSHSLQKVRTDRHSVSLHCLFPLTFSGFFGFLGFFFPKKNPKRSARRSLAYALFPMPGRRARSPGNNVSLRGVGQRSMRPLLQKICTDIHSVALPRLFHLPFFGFFGSLGFFFPKKNPKRSARRSLAYIPIPLVIGVRGSMPSCFCENPARTNTLSLCLAIYLLPQCGFFGSRGLFPQKVLEWGMGRSPIYNINI